MEEQFGALVALGIGGLLLWLFGKAIFNPIERQKSVAQFRADPVLFILAGAACLCVAAFLLWVGSFGALPLGKAGFGAVAFGLAAVVWDQTYSRKR